MSRRAALGLLLGTLPFALAQRCEPDADEGAAAIERVIPLEAKPTRPEYEAARQLVDRRCVVCHGCYDAPCQLLLGSPEGLARGASKERVYRASRLRAAQPTRLGIDATSVEGWRELGFFSVTEQVSESLPSPIFAMLALGAAYDFPPDEPLPPDFPLDRDRTLTCARPEEIARYAEYAPHGGMPYGMTSLPPEELRAIGTWLVAEPPVPAPLPVALAAESELWEERLNDAALKQRVVSRYLFEHWAFAHLWFESHPEGPFFEIVRSKTPPGEPVEPIATRFPYDDPGVPRFWYRLRPIDGTILHKTHITYRLGPSRWARFQELFLGDDWQPTRFPSWDPDQASNPFVTFDEIPARSRYQFLLDDSLYFVRTFIRGPVCNGQVATDVIRDRFFVTFLDPNHDVSIVDPSLLNEAKQYLRLPAEAGANMSLLAAWRSYDKSQTKWRDLRAAAYRRWLDGRPPDLSFGWDGDGIHRGALLTVFRHYDNANVVEGWIGADPKTVWVMDFPIFERIYYDLVTGFDVFGNVGHQLGVRLYMDNLRMESEDLFLALLPEPLREPLRASWYVGATEQIDYTHVNALRSQGIRTGVRYRTQDPMTELIGMILERNAAVAGPPDRINRCTGDDCARDRSPLEQRAERALRRLAARRGRFAAPLPEVSLLRVTDADAAVVYTLAHDRLHTNVAAMFDEEDRLIPDEDRVTVVPGILGSHPNFAFDVPVSEMEAFVDAVLALRGESDVAVLASRWGVRRTSPRFWSTLDWMQDRLLAQDAREAGLLDLHRYGNP